MLLFITKTTIIGIILTIALISVSAAVCIYLAANADKMEEVEEQNKEKEE